MGLPINTLDNASTYMGLLNDLERDRRVDPPDDSTINGRAAVDDDEKAVIKAAREQERLAGAAMVAGIGREKK